MGGRVPRTELPARDTAAKEELRLRVHKCGQARLCVLVLIRGSQSCGGFWNLSTPGRNYPAAQLPVLVGVLSTPQYSPWGSQYSSWGPQYSSWDPQYSSWGPQYSSRGPQYSSWAPQYSSWGPQYSFLIGVHSTCHGGPQYSSQVFPYSPQTSPVVHTVPQGICV